MLELEIYSGDIGDSWAWADGVWRCGKSWIEPYAHPCLEGLLITDGASWCAAVRERRRDAPIVSARPNVVTTAEFRRRVVELRRWPGDFVVIEGDADEIHVSTGVQGVAPLYLTACDGRLYGSWDLTDLRGRFAADSLVEREVVRLLALRPRYTHETVFAGVHRLTERATISWDGTGLTVRYPSDAQHSIPRELRDDADVIEGYETLLDQFLDATPYEPGTAAVELSGGLDSANVAASLATRAPDRIVTAAMLLPGPAGEQQQRRRNELIDVLGFRADVVVSARRLAPLCPSGARAQGFPISPYDEPYLEAIETLHHAVAARGVRTVFTGIGGDEMVALTKDEVTPAPVGADRDLMPWLGPRSRELAEEVDEEIAPVSVVNEMTLLACACAAPAILRAGMWPVHPLADPALIRFGEWLPRSWRADKHLPRARLAARGLSPDVCRPQLAENFTQVMDNALARHGAGYLRWMLATGSPLIDHDFIDPDQLTQACDRLATGTTLDRDREVFEVINLDQAIRSLHTTTTLVG